MTRYVVSISFLIFSLSATVTAENASQQDKCYLPNGEIFDNGDPSSSHKPCTVSGLPTICCAVNRQNPPGGDSRLGVTRDECLPNGLCQNRMITNGVEITTFWANYCTDRNITSGNCLNICRQSRNSMGYTAMTSCNGRADSDRWCCGQNNSACCATGVGVLNLPQKFVAKSNITFTPSSSNTVSEIASTTTSAPSHSSTMTTLVNDSKYSAGTIAGIVIGTLAGFAVLGALLFLALRRHSQKDRESGNLRQGDIVAPYYMPTDGNHVYGELNSQNEKYELPYTAVQELQQPPCELPGTIHSDSQRRPAINVTTPHGSQAVVQSGSMF